MTHQKPVWTLRPRSLGLLAPLDLAVLHIQAGLVTESERATEDSPEGT
jgi:hypothetical protein